MQSMSLLPVGTNPRTLQPFPSCPNHAGVNHRAQTLGSSSWSCCDSFPTVCTDLVKPFMNKVPLCSLKVIPQNPRMNPTRFIWELLVIFLWIRNEWSSTRNMKTKGTTGTMEYGHFWIIELGVVTASKLPFGVRESLNCENPTAKHQWSCPPYWSILASPPSSLLAKDPPSIVAKKIPKRFWYGSPS